jgi:hypothetical protein
VLAVSLGDSVRPALAGKVSPATPPAIAPTFFGLSSWHAADSPGASPALSAKVIFGTLSHSRILWKSATTAPFFPRDAMSNINYLDGTYDFGYTSSPVNNCGDGRAESIANYVSDAIDNGLVQCDATGHNCAADMIVTLGPEGDSGTTWSTCPMGTTCTTAMCRNGKGCAFADYMHAFGNFVGQVAANFNGSDQCHPYIKSIELWNEFNGPEYWGQFQTDNSNCDRTMCAASLPTCADGSDLLTRMSKLAQIAYCCLSANAQSAQCPASAVALCATPLSAANPASPSRVLTPSVTGPIDTSPSTLPACAADTWMKSYLGDTNALASAPLADYGSFHGYIVKPNGVNSLPPPWPEDESQTQNGSYIDFDQMGQTCSHFTRWPGNNCYGTIQDRLRAMRVAFNSDPSCSEASCRSDR